MTNEEIVEQGEFVDQAGCDYDGCGNYWESMVYKVGEDLWMVEFLDGKVCSSVKPCKVKAFEVTRYEYEPI